MSLGIMAEEITVMRAANNPIVERGAKRLGFAVKAAEGAGQIGTVAMVDAGLVSASSTLHFPRRGRDPAFARGFGGQAARVHL